MIAADAARYQILLVDDEPLVCKTMTTVLGLDGHHVTITNSAEKALACFQPGKFDIVITDFSMPTMTGLELAIAIKAQAPRQPIILLTAYAERFRSQPPLPAIDRIMDKPLHIAELRAAIHTLAPVKNRDLSLSKS